MKNILSSLLLICMGTAAMAQVTSYGFSRSAGTYVPLSGGTPLIPPNTAISGAGWFQQCYNVPLPFVFFFNGKGYSSVFINSNGSLDLGKAASVTNPRAALQPDGQDGTIMAYACRSAIGYSSGPGSILLGGLIDSPNAHPILYSTIGVAPNRIFVVQWTNAYRSLEFFTNRSSIESMTFQIRLKEGSNTVELVYDKSFTTYSSIGVNVGLGGASSSDIKLLEGSSWASATVSSNPGAAQLPFTATDSIPSGITYDFTPSGGQQPVACSGTPTAPTVLSTTGMTNSSATLSLAGLPRSTGLTYQWQSSALGAANSWAGIQGATDATYTATPNASAYYRCLVACGAGTPVATNALGIGYESAFPDIPSYTYGVVDRPQGQIGHLNISGALCGSSFDDGTNALSSYGYPVSGVSGVAYNYLDHTTSMGHIQFQGDVSAASTYTVTINNSGGPASVYVVWIDLNDNGSFDDAGERLGGVSNVAGSATSFTVTLPAGNFGMHRLRVRGASSDLYTTADLPAAGPVTAFGQVIDYTAEILLPATAASANTPVCVNDVVSLQAIPVAGATYTWTGPAGYTTGTTSTTAVYTVTSTNAGGKYDLFASIGGANTCVSSVSVTVNPLPAVSITGTPATICQGSTTAALRGSFSGGATSAIWSDNGAGGTFARNTGSTPSSTTYTASASAPSSVQLILTSGGGSCGTAADTVTLAVDPPPVANISGTPSAICQGATTAALNGSLGGHATSAIWSDNGAGGTFTNNTGTTPSTATYHASATSASSVRLILTATGGVCHSEADTVMLTVNPVPTVNISGTPAAICLGGTTATLGGSFGAAATSAVWSDNGAGGTFTDNNGGTPAAATYTSSASPRSSVNLILTSGGGLCPSAADTVTLTLDPLPNIDVISNSGPACSGTTLSLNSSASGGTGTLAYAWNGPSGYNATGANPSITQVPVGATGTYTLTVTDNNHCVATGINTTNATVTYTPPIAGVIDIMANGTSHLSDAAASGVWSSSVPSVASITANGTVTAGAGAGTAIISYQVGGNCPSLVNVIVYPQSLCIGTSILLSDNAGGGTWSTTVPAIATVNATTGLVTGINMGTAVIKHTVGGTINSFSVTVNALQPMTGLDKVCQTATIAMGNNTAGGGTWSASNTAIATIGSTGIMTGVSGGYADAVFTSARGCVVAKNILVNPTAPIVVPGAVCVGQTITLNNAVGGGTWSSSVPAMASISLTTGMVYGIATGTPYISYTLPTGCVRTTSVVVNPLSATTGIAALCQGLTGSMANVTTGGGAWTSSNTSIAAISGTGVITAVGAGVATISFTTTKNCITTKPLTVNPVPAISGITTVCVAQTTQLSGSVAGGTWSSNVPGMAGINTAGLVSGVSAGNPAITYGLPTGCIRSASVTVNPLVASTGAATICMGHTLTLANSTTGGGTWTSTNSAVATVGLTTGIVSATAAGTANILFTTSRGCVTSKPETVNICPTREANTASVDEATAFGEIKMFPNPNTGTFTLQGTLSSTEEQDVAVTVVNMLGQVVYSNNIVAHSGSINEQVTLGATLASGTYMLHLGAGDDSKVFHFVITK